MTSIADKTLALKSEWALHEAEGAALDETVQKAQSDLQVALASQKALIVGEEDMKRRTTLVIADFEDRIAWAKVGHVAKQEEVYAAAEATQTCFMDVTELILKKPCFALDQQKARDKYDDLVAEMNEACMAWHGFG